MLLTDPCHSSICCSPDIYSCGCAVRLAALICCSAHQDGPRILYAVEVLDIEKAKVRGLKGLEYLDKVRDGQRCMHSRHALLRNALSRRACMHAQERSGGMMTWSRRALHIHVVLNPALRLLQTVDPKNPAKKTEDREEITFTGPTDR